MNTDTILNLNNDGTVTLCARKTCCPILEKVGENSYKITDDFGGSIVIDREQAKLIVDGIEVVDRD